MTCCFSSLWCIVCMYATGLMSGCRNASREEICQDRIIRFAQRVNDTDCICGRNMMEDRPICLMIGMILIQGNDVKTDDRFWQWLSIWGEGPRGLNEGTVSILESTRGLEVDPNSHRMRTRQDATMFNFTRKMAADASSPGSYLAQGLSQIKALVIRTFWANKSVA